MPLTLEAIRALLVTTFYYGAAVGCLFFTLVIVSLMISQTSDLPKARRRGSPVHLLVVLGSGGHTAEMIAILERHFNFSVYTYRTYVVSSGDALSAQKAVDFEAFMAGKNNSPKENHDYTVVTIPRARRVHQSYLTAPFSTLQCFWACLLVLLGRHPEQHPLPAEYKSSLPDIILANGPAVAVCMMLAAKSLRFLIFCFKWTRTQDPDSEIPKLRTVYIESWARVRRLSMSGRILLPVADRFLVQWAPLAGLRAWWGMRPTIFCGWVVI